MPDITMCANDICPLRKSCYRSPYSGTEESGRWQSWSSFSFSLTDEGYPVCENFAEVREKPFTGSKNVNPSTF